MPLPAEDVETLEELNLVVLCVVAYLLGLNMPGSDGLVNLVAPGILMYTEGSKIKPRYPNRPPPNVVGTRCV